jgi:hypothetical protein
VLQLDAGVRSLARHPVITLVVHQLMVPMWVVMVVVVRACADGDGFAVLQGHGSSLWPAPLLALGLSLLFELGRKIHHTDDEVPLDDSYSALWGPRLAALVVVAVAAGVAAVVAVVTSTLSLPVWSALVPGVALVWVMATTTRFAIAPRRHGGRAIALSTALASLWVYLPLVAGAVVTHA